MNQPAIIDIKAYADTVDVSKNPEFVKHMKEALIWLAKREQFSHEYYSQLKRNSAQKKLEESMWMDDNMTRVRFEAATLAYLQNIHAACDAFPFALHILLGGLNKKQNDEDEHFKWNLDLIKRVEAKYPRATKLHANLHTFLDDENFAILASLVNQGKHKYFPRILTNLEMTKDHFQLILEDFEYIKYVRGVKTRRSKERLDILEFAKTIHDETLVSVYRLYRSAYDAVIA
jgi:hypothetical protein